MNNTFTRLTLVVTLLLSNIFLITPARTSAGRAEVTISSCDVVGGYTIKRAHFAKIPSTQTLAYDIITELTEGSTTLMRETFNQDRFYEKEVLLITADEQTAGIGYNGRAWQSPPGNIYATFIFPWPEKDRKLLFFVSQITNLAVCETVEHFGLRPQIKWINDMLLDGKKSAGVLCKVEGDIQLYQRDGSLLDEDYASLVVGIGLNVNMDQALATERFDATSDRLKVPFTSMSIDRGRKFVVEEVLDILKMRLLENYLVLLDTQDPKPLVSKISTRLAYVGQEVEYTEDTMNGGVIHTRRLKVLGITTDGAAPGSIILSDGGETFTTFNGRIRPVTQTT